MNTPVRLALFAIGLVAVFGAAVGLGAMVGPVGPAAEKTAPAEHHGGSEEHSP